VQVAGSLALSERRLGVRAGTLVVTELLMIPTTQAIELPVKACGRPVGGLIGQR